MVLDELVGALEELSSEDNNRGGTISDFSVLDLGKFDEDLGGGVGNLKLLENSGAIIGNSNITDIVDEHFVEALGSEGRLNDVSQTGYGSNYTWVNRELDICRGCGNLFGAFGLGRITYCFGREHLVLVHVVREYLLESFFYILEKI